MQWILASTSQHNKFLEQTRIQLWVEGPSEQSSHSNSDHLKTLCANAQNSWTHQMLSSSPPFILPLTELFQNANYLLPSLSLSFSPSRLTALSFTHVFWICLRERHNYIKWKAIGFSLHFSLGFSAHLVWQKDCDKIFCAFQLCTEWQCSLLDKLTSFIKLSIEF